MCTAHFLEHYEVVLLQSLLKILANAVFKTIDVKNCECDGYKNKTA